MTVKNLMKWTIIHKNLCHALCASQYGTIKLCCFRKSRLVLFCNRQHWKASRISAIKQGQLLLLLGAMIESSAKERQKEEESWRRIWR